MKIEKSFDNDIKVAYMTNYTKMIVDAFLAYEKHYDITKFNFSHIVKESKDEINLTEDEMKIVVQNVKWYLLNYNGIEIFKENPLEIRKFWNQKR